MSDERLTAVVSEYADATLEFFNSVSGLLKAVSGLAEEIERLRSERDTARDLAARLVDLYGDDGEMPEITHPPVRA